MDLALKSVRILDFCGKPSRFADFENTVDRRSETVLTIFGLMVADSISQLPILVLNTDLSRILHAASGTICLCMLGRPQILRVLW